MNKEKRKWWILSAMCLLTIMLNVDVTALNIAIPVISKEFYADLSSMQWVINAYVLLSAMFQILGGRLGDTYGHRKIFLFGTALFVLSSAGAGLSVDTTMLIAFRVLQGLALGIAYPMTIVLTFEAFPKNQQGFALSFIVASMGISLAIGPPIGGLFVEYIGWRWIFYINVPLGIIAYLIARIYCAPHKAKKQHYIDYKGASLLVLGLLGITLALNQVQNWGLVSPLFLASLVLGVLFLAILYFIEKKQSYPIIDFKLFRIRNLLLNNCIRMVVQWVFVPLVFFIPVYLQNISGLSAIYSGLLMLFLTIVIGVLSPIAGKWVDTVGDKLPNIVSMFLFAIACFLLSLLGQVPEIFVLGIALLLVGIATGITFVSTVTGSTTVAPAKQQGEATGIIFTTAWLGCALGVALVGGIIALSGEHYLQQQLAQLSSNFSSNQMEMIERVSKGVASFKDLSHSFSGESLTQATALSRESFMHGFRVSMQTLTVLSLIGAVLSFFLKQHKIRQHQEIPPA